MTSLVTTPFIEPGQSTAKPQVPVSLLRQQLHKLLVAKMDRAGYQTHYLPCVVQMKQEFLKRYCGVTSSRQLDAAMCEYAIEQLQSVTIAMPRKAQHKRPTIQQRKKIARLGKYVLGAVYGDQWFWNNLPVWIGELYAGATDLESGVDISKRTVRKIDNLTQYEAWYIIQRMEKVEFKLHKDGRV
ncbi:MAG: hypothetical protein M5R41_10475 [Bacteroidia bacterium]|nr:hypothetical protein [Bacteroidia bacterium]